MYVEIKYVQLLPISQIAIPECTEVRFVSFLSGGFITAIVVNPPERKLEKRTSVEWSIFLQDIKVSFIIYVCIYDCLRIKVYGLIKSQE